MLQKRFGHSISIFYRRAIFYVNSVFSWKTFALGGHAKTLMFAHVSPEADSFGETVSTLKFAQRVSTVELGAARLNKESSEIMQLKEQVRMPT